MGCRDCLSSLILSGDDVVKVSSPGRVGVVDKGTGVGDREVPLSSLGGWEVSTQTTGRPRASFPTSSASAETMTSLQDCSNRVLFSYITKGSWKKVNKRLFPACRIVDLAECRIHVIK